MGNSGRNCSHSSIFPELINYSFAPLLQPTGIVKIMPLRWTQRDWESLSYDEKSNYFETYGRDNPYSNYWVNEKATKNYNDHFLKQNPLREDIFTYILWIEKFDTFYPANPQFPWKAAPENAVTKYQHSTMEVTIRQDFHTIKRCSRAFIASAEKYFGPRIGDDLISDILQHSGPDPLKDTDNDYLNDWAEEVYYKTSPNWYDSDNDYIYDGVDKEPLKYNRRVAFILDCDEKGEWNYGDDFIDTYADTLRFDYTYLLTTIRYPMKSHWEKTAMCYMKGSEFSDWDSDDIIDKMPDVLDTINSGLDSDYPLNDPPPTNGEDIVVVHLHGHGKYNPWELLVNTKWHGIHDSLTESEIKNEIVNKFGEAVKLILLDSCYSTNAFDQWGKEDDCIIWGNHEGGTGSAYPLLISASTNNIMPGLQRSYSVEHEFGASYYYDSFTKNAAFSPYQIEDNYGGDLYLGGAWWETGKTASS